jgi:hypothetical protein
MNNVTVDIEVDFIFLFRIDNTIFACNINYVFFEAFGEPSLKIA